MSKICDKSVFVIFRPINTHYCHSRGCTLQHNLHSVFSQRPCSPDTYFAMQCYSRVHYFALYFSCIFNLKRIGSQVNEDDDFHNLGKRECWQCSVSALFSFPILFCQTVNFFSAKPPNSVLSSYLFLPGGAKAPPAPPLLRLWTSPYVICSPAIG